jgi:hypothetical protein
MLQVSSRLHRLLHSDAGPDRRSVQYIRLVYGGVEQLALTDVSPHRLDSRIHAHPVDCASALWRQMACLSRVLEDLRVARNSVGDPE